MDRERPLCCSCVTARRYGYVRHHRRHYLRHRRHLQEQPAVGGDQLLRLHGTVRRHCQLQRHVLPLHLRRGQRQPFRRQQHGFCRTCEAVGCERREILRVRLQQHHHQPVRERQRHLCGRCGFYGHQEMSGGLC